MKEDYTQARKFSAVGIEEFKTLIKELTEQLNQHFSHEKPGHKFHQTILHMTDFMDRHKTVNFFSEQAIESTHAMVNRDMLRIKTSDQSRIADSLLRWAHERTVLYDEFGIDTSQIDEDIDESENTEIF
ncbi:unnamed protein product [Bursaphelenchus xylophilus]|uniref:(pine wood nematode) hypothetical protein n=1 Tax=Bursaphelenchus xylophilus TaxID=6326 RepID=A0A1I7SK18_BURXY|nr:unnamed protein product [Bursaphelenchus xylophilus]CAG9099042.1 unnamed protein product [Bursaphelenchus xylophilus]